MAEPLKKSELTSEPEAPQPFRNQELHDRAESLDSVPVRAELRVDTLGSNVVELRQPGLIIDDVPTDAGPERSPLDAASGKYHKAQAAVEDFVERGRDRLYELIGRGRRRVRYWADEYPLELVGVVAGVGFVAGVLLRIWRSNRHE